MTEYYNDPSELYDEELIKKQEKNDELAIMIFLIWVK